MSFLDALGYVVFVFYFVGNLMTVVRFRQWSRAADAHFALPRKTAEEWERSKASWEAFSGFWHGPAGARYVMGPATIAAVAALAYAFTCLGVALS